MSNGRIRIEVYAILIIAMVFASLGEYGLRTRDFFDAIPAAALTATPTPTPTSTPAFPSPTPSPVPTPVLHAKITHFGFLGVDSASNGLYAGYVEKLKATIGIPLSCPVQIDPNNDEQVIPAGVGTTTPLGVVVGSSGPVAANLYPGIGIPPVAGQNAIIQVNGIYPMICDGAIQRGSAVMVSSLIACAITPYSAGTVDEEIGIALKACTAYGNTDVLILK
jgi:hypothetical protein